MTGSTIIIGATGGVGRALTHRLAAAGTPLHLIGRGAAALTALGTEVGASVATADATDADALAAAVAAAGGAIAGLAYCVGSIDLMALKKAKVDDFMTAFRLNAVGAAVAVQAAEAGLKAAGGSVVLFSTVAVAQGFPNHAVTAAAKGAVEGLARSLAVDLAPKARVNCIAPSLLDTAMAAPLVANAAVAKGIADMHPLPRLGEAADAAALAAFLLSPEAGWITGQVIGVDGGRATLRKKA